MPDIGEGIAEVELVAWYVKVGDVVAEDQILADVMTEKATVEIPSSAAGKVLSLGGVVGEVMAVGSEVIRIEVDGVGNVKAEPADALLKAPAASATKVTCESAPIQPDAFVPPAAAAHKPDDKPLASPSVRHRAREMGIELQLVRGSGPAGRIVQEDLEAHVAREASKSNGGAMDQRYVKRHDEQRLPVIGLRRKIAQKMQESKRHIPHFTYVEEVDVTELEVLRARLNTRRESERGRLTILPFLMRAIVLAAREFPQINARYDDEADVVTRFGAVHLGIATQTEAGLMVPVVRHAETRDLWACATEVLRLADAARTGKATRDELSGSTITITSLGALGGIVSTPVINYPEVAIIGINRIVERPMIRGGAVVACQMMNLSSSFDHRVVDGMHAAEFVQSLRGYLECPGTLFVG
jgi:2-oxoisovalerate dehydrogenase E2 component (dihydrolipoyl transacylase)